MAVTKTQLFANNAATTLAGDIAMGALSMNVAPGSGVLFPNPGANSYFLCTLSDVATGLQIEIVKVTAVSGDAFTIARAQEGTAAQAWTAGSTVQLRPTAGTLTNLPQPPALQIKAGDYAANTGTRNALVVDFGVTPASLSVLVGAPLRILKDAQPNNGAVTIAVNGNSAKPIVDLAGNALIANAIPANCIFTVVYDGTQFFLQNAPATSGPGRLTLNGNLDLYVATTGNDSNDGLSVGTPWATLQHAWNVVFQSYDLAGFSVTVNVADGTYSAGVSASGQLAGAGAPASMTFKSSSGSASACIVNGSGNTFDASDGAEFLVRDVKVTSSGGSCIRAGSFGKIDFLGLIFGAAGGGFSHISIANTGRVNVVDDYTIAGNALAHFNIAQNGVLTYSQAVAVAVTLTGTPVFTDFGIVSNGGVALVPSGNVSFSGGATGARYSAITNGVIDTNGGGASFLPGSTPGSTATGGQYV